MTEWNEWRKKNPDKDVCLDGANLQGFYLRNANFIHAMVSYSGEGRETDYSGKVYLREANLKDVNAEQAWFGNAHLEKTYWWYANARDIDFHGAHLEEAHLGVSKLDECRFSDSHLMNASLTPSSLRGANFLKSDLRGCSIRSSVVDGSTRFWECIINRYSKNERFTDLTGVPLDNVIIDPTTKQLLEYNIRRMNWEEWYKEHSWLKWFVKPFWWVSNYGLSTGRIIITFFVLAVAFACIYYICGLIAPPGIVDYLFVDANGVEIAWWLVLIRAIHFSVVIMTVGFTNMHANAHSFWAHILVSLQMILGFVLLGALVTRFAVLFTAGGPAGKFADENKKEDADNNNDEVS
jgi:hypothetical protein